MNQEITREIEQYIAGELSSEQRVLFEQKMASNEELFNEVNLQMAIHEAAQRTYLRNEIAGTGKQYHFRQNLKWGGISFGIILFVASIAAISVWGTNKSASFNAQDAIERLKDSLKNQGLIDNLNSEFFVWNANDTAFLSKDGVLVSVPDNAFILDGKPYTEEAVIQWQEALDGATIVKAGLSTTSNGRLLETQGMFSFTAKTLDGKQLTIDPKVGVYVQVPVDDYKEGMQLFDGVKDAKGMINWVKPRKLEKIPVPVNMAELDFYPSEYETTLNELKARKGKKYRDSLYLSFENIENDNFYDIDAIPQFISYTSRDKMKSDPIFPGDQHAIWKFLNEKTVYPNDALEKEISGIVWVKFLVSETGNISDIRIDRSVHPSLDEEAMRIVRSMPNWIPGRNTYDQSVRCELILPVNFVIPGVKMKKNFFLNNAADENELAGESNSIDENETGARHVLPSSVLAFWNNKFNNTILATREFEERMKEIHKTCDPSVLDIYVKNMNLPLYALDEKVATKGYSRFRHFADQQVGAIELKNPHLTALSGFYDKAIEALKRQEKGFRDRENNKRKKWDQLVNDERQKESTRSEDRDDQSLDQEYNLNLKNVEKQLGRVIGATIHGGGTICNIDRYVMESTSARESISMYDPVSGKKAKIQYNDFSFTVANHEEYSQIYAYLFPSKLNSYHRIDGNDGSFNFPLNNAMEYDLVVVGISENGYSYLQSESLKGGDLGELELETVSEKQLDAQIRQMNSKRGIKAFDVKQELKWLKTEQQNYVEQRRRSDDRKFRNLLRPKVFPCDCVMER